MPLEDKTANFLHYKFILSSAFSALLLAKHYSSILIGTNTRNSPHLCSIFISLLRALQPSAPPHSQPMALPLSSITKLTLSTLLSLLDPIPSSFLCSSYLSFYPSTCLLDPSKLPFPLLLSPLPAVQLISFLRLLSVRLQTHYNLPHSLTHPPCPTTILLLFCHSSPNSWGTLPTHIVPIALPFDNSFYSLQYGFCPMHATSNFYTSHNREERKGFIRYDFC